MAEKPHNFWEELKRRKVIRVITVYAAAAFVILELVDIVSPALGLPSWTMGFVIVLLCIGFIISTILSWVYDITPEGVQKTKSSTKDSQESKQPASIGWKISTYASLLIIIAFVVFYIVSNIKQSSDISKLEKTIAVLPFDNMSTDQSYSYLGDAFTDEIILELQKIKEFDRVISRSSTMQFKENRPTIPEIAEILGVNYLIEGAFQRHDEEVSIRIQVIRAEQEDHIWADEYDGKWEEIFSIQDEIAFKVANELKAVLSPGEIEQIEKKPTENSKAYEIYLLGRYNLSIGLEHNLLESIKYFQKALEYDSDYAMAYAGLADAYASLGIFNIYSPEDTWPNARAMANKALELDEQIAEVYISLLIIKMYYEYDWRGIENIFKKAIEINPNNSDAYAWYSMYLSAVGRHEEALSHIEYALDIDPFSQFVKRNYFYVAFFAGQKDKAWQLAQDEMITNAQYPYWLWRAAFYYADLGNYPEAISYIKKQISLMGNDINDAVGFLGYLYGRNGEPEKALQQLEKLDSISAIGRFVSPVNRTFIYIGLDEKQKAIEYLEDGFENKLFGSWLTACVNELFVYDSIRDDPRFMELVSKMGL